MLVDYHVHLEQDAHSGRCPYTRENIDRYVESAAALGISEIGITEHCNRFVQFLPVFESVMDKDESIEEITRWIRDGCTEDLDEYVSFVGGLRDEGYPIKLSIEVDYIDGEEERIAEILAGRDWDYILGSVHFVGDWAVDYSPERGWPGKDIDDVYGSYFRLVSQAIRSGLFDCIAHPDLVKKLGFRASRQCTPYYRLLAKDLKETGMAYEVSTAGLFKTVCEIYPSKEFVRVLHEEGVPAVISSDAHDAAEIGRRFPEAVSLLESCGYSQIARFTRRSYQLVALGVDNAAESR